MLKGCVEKLILLYSFRYSLRYHIGTAVNVVDNDNGHM